MFGGKIYNALEKVQLFMVIWIISYLIIIDLFMVPASVWWTTIKGFLGVEALQSQGQGGQQLDWVLLGAFAAYAGSGGLGNVTITNYVRDKGWGMSSLVGAIPSMIGGQNVTLSHWGKVFRISPENLKRFKEWWKYVRFEQYGIWLIGCFIGIALPAMLTIAFVPAGQEMDQWSAAGFQADGLAAKGGRVMWYLTLLCGFWVLFSTQLGGVDGVPRTYTDIIWTGLKRARKLGESNAKWIYYPILGIYILWGVIAMYLAKPFFMILVSATIGGYLLVITALHTLYVNRKFLPPEIQPPYVETDWVGVVCRVLFDFRDGYCLAKSACALCFPDFWVGEVSGLQTRPTKWTRESLLQGSRLRLFAQSRQRVVHILLLFSVLWDR